MSPFGLVPRLELAPTSPLARSPLYVQTAVLSSRCAHARQRSSDRLLFLGDAHQPRNSLAEPHGGTYNRHLVPLRVFTERKLLLRVLRGADTVLPLYRVRQSWGLWSEYNHVYQQHWGWHPQLDIHEERGLDQAIAEIWN